MTTLEKQTKRGDIKTANPGSTTLPHGRQGKTEAYQPKMDASNKGKGNTGLPDCK